MSMVFASARQNGALEDIEEVPMEDGTTQVA